MEKEKLAKEREYNVYKSNALIQKTRYNLTTVEQKIVLRLIQMIEPDDDALKIYEFSIKEFCELCGIDYDNGGNYAYIKDTLKNIRDNSFYITLEDGYEIPVSWIERPFIRKSSGTVKIKLDEYLKPYLLNLKEYFTAYSLKYVIAMKGKYSIRLYELLKSYLNMHKKEFELSHIQTQLMADVYDRWVDFKRRVIESSIVEINELSDINVSYTPITAGRRVTGILFKISLKTSMNEKLDAWKNIEKRLTPKEIKKILKAGEEQSGI